MNQQEKQELLRQLPRPLLGWYAQNARDLPWRRDTQPYHVWLSEIMLQQTRVEAVKGYYTRFLQSLPTIEALAAAPQEQLFKLWEGLGYYNRAKNLQKAALQILREHSGTFPREWDSIIKLPGIGAYTAGAIASICFEQPTPAVDGNVLRVLARLTMDSRCVDLPQVKKEQTQALEQVYPKGECGAFTQALMELGALVCLPNGAPQCGQCPLAFLCSSRQNGCEKALPVKAPKKERRVQTLSVFVIACAGRIALVKRGDTGVLSGQWELPNLEGDCSEQQAFLQLRDWGIKQPELNKHIRRKHVFTHIEWKMNCYFFRSEHAADCFFWAELRGGATNVALPTAFRKLLDEF